MSLNKYFLAGAFLFFILCFNKSDAQVIENNGLKIDVAAIAAISKKLPVEKLYMQFDKPYYSIGDTIRFKAYLLNANYLTLSTHSKLLYVELDDKNNKPVKRIMTPIAAGISWGDLALVEKDVPEGSYTIRAYTNWMRNFGEDYVFKKNFYISPPVEQALLVNTGFKLTNNNLQANLQFTNLDKQPLSGQMQLQVTDEKKTIYKTIIPVAADGRADINFTLPDKTDVKHLYIIATEVSVGSSNRSAVIPVTISRPENTDIKFMPEGGSFIAGLPAHIGFEATAENGKDINVSGNIYNSHQQQVATFKSVHNGIGSFELTPKTGENYTAKLTLPDGTIKNYSLPAVSASGTTLSVSTTATDSLQLTMRTGINLPNTTYYLIGQARGVICYGAVINFKEAVVKNTISKNLFPTGICRFTLLDAAHQPLNERMVYVNHSDDLHFSINTAKPNYTTRDSIALSLQVTDKTGKPEAGTFSVSVTDDTQVKIAGMPDNISNYLLFTSDLKANVEEPGYYFDKNSPDRIKALDDLLLTHDYTGYTWAAIFNPALPQPAFAAETEFAIRGRVTNIFNKPVAGTQILLLSKKPAMVLDAKTDDKGQFVFNGFMPVDTAVFLIQAKNKHGNSSNVGIDVDEFKKPQFKSEIERQWPWYVNTDTVLLNNTLKQIAQQQEAGFKGKGKQLKEVTIRSSKIIKDSKNLNGPGESDQSLDLADMEKAGKMTLRQILEQKVKGFTLGQVKYPPDNQGQTHPGDPQYRNSYKINEKEIRFVFDGVDLSYFYYAPEPMEGPATRSQRGRRDLYNSLSNDWKSYVDSYIDYYTAEDITGIEVMYNPQYNESYVSKYLSVNERASIGADDKYAYIEITTRSGQGPFMKKTPGTYIYRPLPVSLPKPFYSPKYTTKNSDIGVGTDLRQTIYWYPGIVTDTAGKANFSFYSADKPGSYTLIIEGIDLNGEPGYQKQEIKIAPK